MSRDLNHVTLIGRLVRNPEVKYTAAGVAIAKFSIANNASYTQNGELKEVVNYFDINVWGNQAVNCGKYLFKGSQVAIDGSLRQNRWNDATTGQGRSKIEITANSVQFLGQPNQQQKQEGSNFNQNTPITTNTDNSYPNNSSNNGNNSNDGFNNKSQDQSNNNQQNSNFIQDPWADNNNSSNDFEKNSFNNNNNNNGGDDIPF